MKMHTVASTPSGHHMVATLTGSSNGKKMWQKIFRGKFWAHTFFTQILAGEMDPSFGTTSDYSVDGDDRIGKTWIGALALLQKQSPMFPLVQTLPQSEQLCQLH